MVYYGEEKRAFQNKWMKDRRQKYINRLGGKCVKCDTTEDLQFHHKDRYEKEFSINKIMSYEEEFVNKELDKCELLCRTHHKEMHTKSLIHGTSTAYGYGCRCDECRAANAAKKAEYRARTGKR